jgi:hypothetical protein
MNIRLDNISLSFSAQAISEVKTAEINCDCANESINLQWLNYLGGFDQWVFTAKKDHILDVIDAGETKQNIFPEWPKSYGEFASTINKSTFREATEQKVIRSQYLTEDQLDAVRYIATSPVVQIVNSRQDRRTVIVVPNSFTYKKEGDKLFMIELTIKYTDQIPSQRL